MIQVKENTFDKKRYVVALGFFDGFHVGHQYLIKKVKEIASFKQLLPMFITFDKHPLSYMNHTKQALLMSLSEREDYLKRNQIDTMGVIHFDDQLRKMDAQSFIKQYLISNHIEDVVVGEDFRFGYQNHGTIEDFKQAGLNVYPVKNVQYTKDTKVSSTLIRHLLKTGQLHEANRLLTRPYTITGEVIHGKKRGREIGYPTANVEINEAFVPKRGVYHVTFEVKNKVYEAMASIGVNPTFNDIYQDSLEVHLFDFHEDIYGEIVTVTFIDYVREEKKFTSIEALINQIKKDEILIRKMNYR